MAIKIEHQIESKPDSSLRMTLQELRSILPCKAEEIRTEKHNVLSSIVQELVNVSPAIAHPVLSRRLRDCSC